MSWQDGIAFEVAFWDRFLGSKGAEWPEDFRRRLDPTLPVHPTYIELFAQLPANPVRVLDVGAGPLTIFGRTHPRKQILLVPTDALAREYDRLLEKHRITPPVRTIYAEAEKLTELFPAESFDFVHAQNSIDHCRSPWEAIQQMLRVAKPGASIRLNHAENEAENERYTGFHQWNFTVVEGDFVIRGQNQEINVTRALASRARVIATCANQWVGVTLQKLSP
jgi:SAM-dependent methyltransferase